MSTQTDKLEQPQQEPVAWMSDDDIDRICDELSLGARGRASFRAGLRYARDIARPAHSRTTEPIAWWNPVNDVALCKSEIERRNGDKGACSIPLYSHPPDLLMTANDAQVSSSATSKEGDELVRAGNELASMLKAASCPSCDGRGWYAVPSMPDGEPEQVQCQWCDMKPTALANWDAALPKDTGDTKGDRLTKAAQP